MIVASKSVHIDLQPFLLSRKKFYQYLYALFLEPVTEEWLYELGTIGNLSELKEFHEGGQILAAFFERLDTEQFTKEREEYLRLFVGPGSMVAPPWESYYRSKEHLLFEKWTVQIREQYYHYGLKYQKENNEPEDHLLLELEFIIFLADLCLQTSGTKRIEKLLTSQQHILEEHLLRWIPDFCKRIMDHTTSRLYLGASMLLEDFLRFDSTTLLEVREALTDV